MSSAEKRMICFRFRKQSTALTRFYSKMHPSACPQQITLLCSDGIKLAAESWSSPMMVRETQPKHVLCLHGWMDNCRSFHYLAPAIVEHFANRIDELATPCKVVALDFPGHGLSSHKSLDGPPTLFADAIFYVNEAVNQLKWDKSEPFTLIGHSMGSAVACLYAAAFPEHIGKLVLLDGGKILFLILVVASDRLTLLNLSFFSQILFFALLQLVQCRETAKMLLSTFDNMFYVVGMD